MQTQLPPTLYKYESFSTQALLNLKKQIVYFGSPLRFNDPYDCALTPNILEPSDAELQHIRDNHLGNADLPTNLRSQFNTTSSQNLRELLLRVAREGFDDLVQEFLATRGVACFSEKNDDLLMWSHYGGQYKGFCLEFDTSADMFEKARKVKYEHHPRPWTLFEIMFSPDFNPVEDLFCTKSTAWRYEREWRALHSIAGTEYGYPSSTLTGIYFGPDIDSQSLEVVCLILAGQNNTVKLWRGRRSTSEFKVLFEPFAYTSYLEAKQRPRR